MRSFVTVIATLVMVAIWVALAWFVWVASAGAACEYYEPVLPNEPTGVKGCERWGPGIASHYGPGNGVAMNFCTWELRHSSGCGSVRITSVQTGLSVVAPVIDWCDCYTGTADERIVDLQYSVVEALGLNWEAGLYDILVEPVEPTDASNPVMPLLPDTRTDSAVQGPREATGNAAYLHRPLRTDGARARSSPASEPCLL